MSAPDQSQVFDEVTELEVRRAGGRKLIIAWRTANQNRSMVLDRDSALALASTLVAAASTLGREEPK